MFLRTLFLFSIVNLVANSYGQRDTMFFRNDYTYIEAVESFYKIHTTPGTWEDANQVCALEGASFWHPENDNEANVVISFWRATQPNIWWVFSAMSDLSTEGLFKTIDGKSVSEVYNRWSPGQPDKNQGREHCTCLNFGALHDCWCQQKERFICKKTLQLLHRNYCCNMFNLDGQSDKKFFRKDYTYIESTDSFYKVHTTPKSFADAKRMCALEGASLFYAENREEADAVVSFWDRTQPQIPWVFVGLSDILSEGFFETVDHKPISEVFSNWQTNQPDNNDGKEDCVHMDRKPSMNDYLCNEKSYFICKKKIQSLEWNYYCNIPNVDYAYNQVTGKCYKLHTTPVTWDEAYATCRTENTSLALISNKVEGDFLAKMTVSSPKPRFHEKYQRGIYHLGFHNRFNEGWQTVAGKPLNVDANIWFDNYQPEGHNYEECGSMFYTGLLINTDCNTKSMFICEHEVVRFWKSMDKY